MVNRLMGIWLAVARPLPHDERGLSQSTENAVLLVGAVAIASIVVVAVKAYVQGHMPQ